MKFNLDFNIYSAKDRLKEVKNIIDCNSNLTPLEIETLSNYILYGKDNNGTSSVDRKEIQIKTKFNSYQKQKFLSLDELMESPSFDECQLQNDDVVYKRVKPTIDKEKAKQIPGMEELWEEIDKWQAALNSNNRKKNKQFTDQKKAYLLKHFLIQLRTQQYYLMDSFYPVIGTEKNYLKYYGDPLNSQLTYPVLPRGTAKSSNDINFIKPFYDKSEPAIAVTDEEIEEWNSKGKIYFNFRNRTHLYYLINNWANIVSFVEDEKAAPLWELIWTFEIYQKMANLSPQQEFILELKKQQKCNKDIQDQLVKQLGIFHQTNYISTIYVKTLDKIIQAVELNYDEWLAKDYEKAWKQCVCCKSIKLRDSRNFIKKNKSVDGLTNRCKECDRRKRLKLPIIVYDDVAPQGVKML